MPPSPRCRPRIYPFLAKINAKLRHQVRHAQTASQRYLLICLLVSAGISLVGILLRRGGVFQSWELSAYDQMVRLRTEAPTDPRLLVVEITEEDIRELDHWPLSDGTIAQALANLQVHQPAAIGLDLYRDIHFPPGKQQLCQQLQARNVFAIYQLTTQGEDYAIAPPDCSPIDQLGFNDFAVDPDNVLRRNLVYVTLKERSFRSFSLQLASYFLNQQGIDFEVAPDALLLGEQVLPRLRHNAGGYHLDPSQTLGWQLLLDWHSAAEVAEKVTLQAVLSHQVEPAQIRNKIVLIGTTAPIKQDLFATPFSTGRGDRELDYVYFMPGVEVHANLVSQLLTIALEHRAQWRFLPQWVVLLWPVVCAFWGGVLVWRLHHPLMIGLGLAVSIAGVWGISYVLFLHFYWVPVIWPGATLLATSGMMLAFKALYGLYHDPLTGLPNRRRFAQLIHQVSPSARGGTSFIGVLCLDINRFRMINDSLGREVGDRLLNSIAQRLQAIIRPTDHLARVGGDEFAIYFQSLHNDQEIEQLANQIQGAIRNPLPEDPNLYLSASIGVALPQENQTSNGNDLLRDADIAMHRAKALQLDHLEIFHVPMRVQSKARLDLEIDLRKAIKEEEFRVHYQPIIALQSGEIIGFEALVRWHSPQRGWVSPGDFIGVTEEMGLIIPLGQWVLEQACCQLSQWHQTFARQPPLIISVNLSNRQLAQPDLLANIRNTLEQFRFFRQGLKLEITESMVMHNADAAIELLHQLKALGIQLSIDDFGTGYSSFNLLHRFPMDTLKIDQAFVRQMEKDAEYEKIVRAIISLSHSLGMDVTAEGVETAHQSELLNALQCEYGQGFFFSKPLPAETATLLLQGGVSWPNLDEQALSHD